MDELDEPNVRGSLIWVIGEYAEKINNADELLQTFMEGFKDEYTQVQLQLLTAGVKLFLKKPQSQAVVQQILQSATSECDNPDIRDRAYVYWRLLSKDPEVAKNIVLSDKPPITSTIQSLPAGLLEELLGEISTLASVYHKPAATFVGQGRFGADAVQKRAIEEQLQNARENPIQASAAAKGQNMENLLDIDFDGAAPASASTQTPSSGGLESLVTDSPARVASPASPTGAAGTNLDDLLSLFGTESAVPANGNRSSGVLDGFEGLNLSSQAAPPPPPPPQQKKANEDILGLF